MYFVWITYCLGFLHNLETEKENGGLGTGPLPTLGEIAGLGFWWVVSITGPVLENV